MNRIRTLLVFAALLAAPAAAAAQELDAAPAPAMSPTAQVATGVAAVLLAILVPVVGVLGRKLARWIDAKTGLDLQRQIDDVAGKAVGYAEQLARQHAAKLGDKMPGRDKLDVALGFLVPIAEAHGWPTWARDRAAQWIEARLGQGAELKLETAIAAEPGAAAKVEIAASTEVKP